MSDVTALPAAIAAALPMPLHSVEWPEDASRPRFFCAAEFGAKCRLVCVEDCGAEQWPCGGYNDDLTEAHRMRDGGVCHVVLFLDADEHWMLDHHTGPISVRWEGDFYSWEPATDAPGGAA